MSRALALAPLLLVAAACAEPRAARTGREGTFPCADARALPAEPATRRSIAEAVLRTEAIDLYLDPRKPGTVVPPKLRSDPGLVLRIGRHMPVPIPDLLVDDDGISGTLSFDGQPFRCEVPWSAVFAIVSTERAGAVWAASTPPEFLCDSPPSGQVAPR